MDYENIADYVDDIYDRFEEVLEEAKRYKSVDDFKMHVFYEMKKFTADLPKICTELAIKEWNKI